MKKPSPAVVAALVEARGAGGRGTSKGCRDACKLGLMEQITAGLFELNMRGQDIADEAIALAKAKGR